jgi:hypothetical protein
MVEKSNLFMRLIFTPLGAPLILLPLGGDGFLELKKHPKS